MSAELVAAKPLWQQVAEALGWVYHAETFTRQSEHSTTTFVGGCWESPDGALSSGPAFDTAWSYAGPLIKRFRIDTGYENGQFSACVNQIDGLSWEDGIGWGDTPQIAICNLILALHKAGKLP